MPQLTGSVYLSAGGSILVSAVVNLDANRCTFCGHEIAGRFEERPRKWGARRMPVVLARSPWAS